MKINTESLVSITEANQNFSRVARLVDKNGMAVILKNNAPRYVVMEYSQFEQEQIMQDEEVMKISRRLMEKNKEAYEVLAK
jgi:antitoxin Phd